MLDQGQLSQEARFLVQGKLERIDYVDSFRGNDELADKYSSTPHQVFITNHTEL